MRGLATAERVLAFLAALGRGARQPTHLYLTGGATAVLEGWREATVDINLLLVPDDELLTLVPGLKERLEVNVEVAAPSHFIPVLPGWEDRSPFVRQEGQLAVHHFDLVAQALAKTERGHERDLEDVAAMLDRGLVDRRRVLETFARIEGELYRFPAIDPPAFRRAVEAAFRPDVFDTPTETRTRARRGRSRQPGGG